MSLLEKNQVNSLDKKGITVKNREITNLDFTNFDYVLVNNDAIAKLKTKYDWRVKLLLSYDEWAWFFPSNVIELDNYKSLIVLTASFSVDYKEIYNKVVNSHNVLKLNKLPSTKLSVKPWKSSTKEN